MYRIDSHVHFSSTGKWPSNNLDCSVKNILNKMDKKKFDKAVLLPLPNFNTNEEVSHYQKIHYPRFIGFGYINNFKNYKQEVNKIKELGLHGIKIHPRIQNISIEEIYDRDILFYIDELNLPIMVCGWTQSHDLDISLLHPHIIDKIAKKIKNLKIIIAHLGGHFFWDAFFCSRSNKNVFLDTSYFTNFFKNTSLLDDFFNSAEKIDDKLFYGSDFPEIDIETSINDFDSRSQFNNTTYKKIIGQNLMNFLNLNE